MRWPPADPPSSQPIAFGMIFLVVFTSTPKNRPFANVESRRTAFSLVVLGGGKETEANSAKQGMWYPKEEGSLFHQCPRNIIRIRLVFLCAESVSIAA